MSCPGLPAGAAWADDELLRRRVELLRAEAGTGVAGRQLVAAEEVASLYERRDFRLLWPDPIDRTTLIDTIEAVAADGLNPDDFHVGAIRRLDRRFSDGGALSGGERVAFDMLMTDALFALLNQLDHGKVDPNKLDTNWHIDRAMFGRDVVELVDEALGSSDIAALVDRARHRHFYYRALRTALYQYRFLADTGGWEAIPDGPTLKPGMRDERVAALRWRLAREGYQADAGTDEPALFDEHLAAAVRTFQERHALDVDGVVGRQTLAELNVPIRARIEQIRVNMERARWVLGTFTDEFVLVNIAGAQVYAIRDDAVVWQSRVIVGKPFTQTPVFRADMRYLVVNPTWNVTPTIARQELFPKIRKDPAYLEKNNFDLVDGEGRRVDPATVDFSGRLPYRIVQRAGADNALGRIKFMFPNRFNVYLHDTPSRDLFARSRRTFSHGCVRVQSPFELAELILAREPDWDPAAFAAIRESSATRTINLRRPVPVLILYWTVEPNIDGSFRFLPDVYGRDGAVLRALDAPYQELGRRG